MALMRPIINVPGLSYWSTTAGNTLDPDSTLSDTTPIVKEIGWNLAVRDPNKVMNWLHNLDYQWNVKTVSSVAGDWVANTDISGTPDLEGLAYSAYRGLWCTYQSGTTSAWKSYDGHVWTSAGALPSAAALRAIGRDTTRIIVGAANGDLFHSNSASLASWTTVAAATVGGGTAAIRGVCTKDPGSDYAIIVREDGTVRIASTGVTGSWSAATTDPPGAPGSCTSIELIYTGSSSTWLMFMESGAGYAYISTDDGDNWSALTLDFAGGTPASMAYAEDSGRLIVAGTNSSSQPHLTYSDDNGASWTTATLPSHWGTANWTFDHLYACGSNVWLASTNNSFATPAIYEPGILMSSNDGATWTEANMGGPTADREGAMFGSDGKKVLLVGESGMTMASLALC